jgi:hypothetical protein
MLIIEVLYHSLGFLLIFLVLFVAFKFFINYRYTEETEMLGGVILLIAFIFGLIITSINLILGLFSISFPLTGDNMRIIAPIFNLVMVVSWLYVFYQLLYANSKGMKIFFYVFTLCNIIFVIIYIILAFILGFAHLALLIEIYDYFSMGVSLFTLIILAVKSIRSKDRILKFRGIFLILGFIVAGVSLVLDDGVFTSTTPFIDLIARILLIIGIFLVYEGFFLTGESKLYHILLEKKSE